MDGDTLGWYGEYLIISTSDWSSPCRWIVMDVSSCLMPCLLAYCGIWILVRQYSGNHLLEALLLYSDIVPVAINHRTIKNPVKMIMDILPRTRARACSDCWHGWARTREKTLSRNSKSVDLKSSDTSTFLNARLWDVWRCISVAIYWASCNRVEHLILKDDPFHS